MSFDAAWGLAKAAVEAGRIPGAVLGVVQGGTRQVAFAGALPARRDTVFDLASLTKPIFTARRILDHAEAGRIELDAPLTSVIPDFRQYHPECWERRVSFGDCLIHRTHFPAVAPIYTYGNDPATLRAFVLQREWARVDAPVYSDINYILLGIALERIEGQTLRDMDPGKGFTFTPDPEVCAPTEACSWRGRVMRGEVHDENCYALQGSGHAGLFGTADALLDFAEALLHDGLGLAGEAHGTRTHGWEIRHNGWPGGALCGARTIGHTGFTGTGLWLDPDAGQAWCLLTNRVHPSRHTHSGIAELRKAVGEAIYGG